MKIVEALKKIKTNREKVYDLQNKIRDNAAHMESHKPEYENVKQKVAEWLQAVRDIGLENETLIQRIQKTNLATNVTIELGGNQITKNISAWVVRRREGVDQEQGAYRVLTNRGLKPLPIKLANDEVKIDQVVLNFSPTVRDKVSADLMVEKSIIDGSLEIVNATTDLLEL